ncbi:DUF6438 domain-containing protein [Mucilaginibacter ginkgonis]|uniref:DUF6438 domain-containing protein n=1 Tax=Mucilaginibacter ginkgonis TaxID=2682091 RepID=A0A6I4HYG2_9SPHI|nr:DUF6438 domain-containing protein [Mucilaginibacter ginkgonis]QQL51392.1 hypothetical protein GO620_008105 [Mucilaginibacter ginkgonis]
MKTPQDVINFLNRLDGSFTTKYSPGLKFLTDSAFRKQLGCPETATVLNLKSWSKCDLNGDGKTDLLAMPLWYKIEVFVAIDNGNSGYKLIRLSKEVFENCQFAKPIIVDQKLMVMFYGKSKVPGKLFGSYSEHIQVDTLIYKFSNFIEYHSKKVEYNVDTIIFHAGMCFGTCPSFLLKISKNGFAEYSAQYYNPTNGDFTGNLHKKKLRDILSLMDYIHLRDLKENYQVNWTDDKTYNLEIKFNDGSVKKISDYGGLGTFGLRALYAMLFELRSSTNWIKSQPN